MAPWQVWEDEATLPAILSRFKIIYSPDTEEWNNNGGLGLSGADSRVDQILPPWQARLPVVPPPIPHRGPAYDEASAALQLMNSPTQEDASSPAETSPIQLDIPEFTWTAEDDVLFADPIWHTGGTAPSAGEPSCQNQVASWASNFHPIDEDILTDADFFNHLNWDL